MSRFFSILFLAFVTTWGYTDCLCKNQVMGKRLPLVTLPESQGNFSNDVDTFSGNYFLVWQQNPGRIKGRLISPQGKKIGPIQSFEGDNTTQLNRIDAFPAVVFNSSNRDYFITWGSTLLDSNSNIVKFETRAQLVSEEGILSDTSFVISDPGINVKKIIHNKINNQYILLYSLIEATGTQSKLFVRRLDSDGTFIGLPVSINSLMGTQIIVADIKHDTKSNRYLVAWDSSSTNPSVVRFQILNPTLQKVGGIKITSLEKSIQPRPGVVYDSQQERFLIIWKGNTELKARAVNSKGILATEITSLGKRSNLAVGYHSGTGTFLLANFKNNRALYLTRLDPSLNVIGDDFLASCQKDNRIGATPISILFNNAKMEFFVTWTYNDVSPRLTDIYGQRIRGTSVQGLCQ